MPIYDFWLVNVLIAVVVSVYIKLSFNVKIVMKNETTNINLSLGMEATEAIKIIESQLTADEQQLLKDTINYGSWGDTSMEFRNDAGEFETDSAWGYCTNDAKQGGHFKGRQVPAMFRSIYKKLCPDQHAGRFMSQCNDWWGDGTGDMLFVRLEIVDELEKWAK